MKGIYIAVIILSILVFPLWSQDHKNAPEKNKPVISSGRVNTQRRFSFQYGRIEASIKLPKTANGLWPAFWLLGDDISSAGWPECGEIDILEMGHKTGIEKGIQERYFNGAAHWGRMENGAHPNYSRFTVSEYSLQDGNFHLYSLVWDKKFIRMYLDGNSRPYFEMNIEAEVVRKYFSRKYFIVFNLAAGGNYPHIYDAAGVSALNEANGFEAKMYIDFVRVYDENGTIIWEDGFDGTVIDERKWNIEENNAGGGNQELQIYSRKNVSAGTDIPTGKSCLILTARME